MDFTPGILTSPWSEGRDAGGDGCSQRWPRSCAGYVVLYSPIEMAADLAENYEGRRDACFNSSSTCLPIGKTSKTLQGDIGQIHRGRASPAGREDWILGRVDHENARTVTQPLTFLALTTHYEAQIYRDGPGGRLPSPIRNRSRSST